MISPTRNDPSNPEWTEADFAEAKQAEALPAELLSAFPNTKKRAGPAGSSNALGKALG